MSEPTGTPETSPDKVARSFLSGEIDDWISAASPAADHPARIRIAGLGTVAERMITSDAFRAQLATAGVEFVPAATPDSLASLLAESLWDMAIIFSPWKRQAAESIRELTEVAREIGSVDSILRLGDRTLGVNSTGIAALAVLQSLSKGMVPASALVLGFGASARSMGWAMRRLWGDAVDLGFAARDPQVGISTEKQFGARIVSPVDISGGSVGSWEVIVNATPWGETLESESTAFVFATSRLWQHGQLFIDLNTRVSSLQQDALAAGAVVTSGMAMRQINNDCRAALASRLSNVRAVEQRD